MKAYFFTVSLCILLACIGCQNGKPYALAREGKSDYAIVTEDSAYGRFAAGEIARVLRASTGVEVPIQRKGGSPAAARKLILSHSALPGAKPLEDGESLVTALPTGDIFIAGKDRALVYGAFHFLEREVGYRDFVPGPDGECIPRHEGLAFSGATYRERPAFDFYRRLYMLYLYGKEAPLFQFRNRGEIKGGDNPSSPLAGMSEPFPNREGGHGFHLYITTERTKNFYPWDEPKDYFKTNPEFFSLDQTGKRTTRLQLCFSNAALRRELLKRFIERGRRIGGKGTLVFGANDWPGAFCECPACRALASKYGCKAGPLVDCLLEILPELKAREPGIRVSVLAYRKSQTEPPPRGIRAMPDNFICDFAPVDDDQGQYLDGSRNQGTVTNLSAWVQLSPMVTYWYYSCINTAPYGIVGRLAHDLPLIRSLGVRGIGLCGLGSPGLFQLQEYLFLRLTVDPGQDAWALVKDYTDFLYGAAAPDFRAYLREVEAVWAENRYPRPLDARAETLLDFTPERLLRWQGMFDRMERLAKGDARAAKFVARSRVDVDYLCLVHDARIRKAHPQGTVPAEALRQRLLAAPILPCYENTFHFRELVETAYRMTLATGKPVPAPLNALPADCLIQIPVCGGDGNRTDEQAVCGMAQTVALRGMESMPKRSIPVCVYDVAAKRTVSALQLDVSSVKPGGYALYRIGVTTIPRDGLLAFDNWIVHVSLAPYYPEGDEFRKFEIWASLKFSGPAFEPNSRESENRLSCDRVFLVRQ